MVEMTPTTLQKNVPRAATSAGESEPVIITQEKLGRRMTDYVQMLAKSHSFSRDIKVDERQLYNRLLGGWPDVPGWQAESHKLLHRIDQTLHDILKKHEIIGAMPQGLVRIQIDSVPLTPQALPEPKEITVIAVFDAKRGLLRHCVLPATEDDPPPMDDMTIPAGIIIMYQKVSTVASRFIDNQPFPLSGGPTIYNTDRNRDPINAESGADPVTVPAYMLEPQFVNQYHDLFPGDPRINITHYPEGIREIDEAGQRETEKLLAASAFAALHARAENAVKAERVRHDRTLNAIEARQERTEHETEETHKREAKAVHTQQEKAAIAATETAALSADVAIEERKIADLEELAKEGPQRPETALEIAETARAESGVQAEAATVEAAIAEGGELSGPAVAQVEGARATAQEQIAGAETQAAAAEVAAEITGAETAIERQGAAATGSAEAARTGQTAGPPVEVTEAVATAEALPSGEAATGSAKVTRTGETAGPPVEVVEAAGTAEALPSGETAIAGGPAGVQETTVETAGETRVDAAQPAGVEAGPHQAGNEAPAATRETVIAETGAAGPETAVAAANSENTQTEAISPQQEITTGGAENQTAQQAVETQQAEQSAAQAASLERPSQNIVEPTQGQTEQNVNQDLTEHMQDRVKEQLDADNLQPKYNSTDTVEGEKADISEQDAATNEQAADEEAADERQADRMVDENDDAERTAGLAAASATGHGVASHAFLHGMAEGSFLAPGGGGHAATFIAAPAAAAAATYAHAPAAYAAGTKMAANSGFAPAMSAPWLAMKRRTASPVVRAAVSKKTRLAKTSKLVQTAKKAGVAKARAAIAGKKAVAQAMAQAAPSGTDLPKPEPD